MKTKKQKIVKIIAIDRKTFAVAADPGFLRFAGW